MIKEESSQQKILDLTRTIEGVIRDFREDWTNQYHLRYDQGRLEGGLDLDLNKKGMREFLREVYMPAAERALANYEPLIRQLREETDELKRSLE